MPLHMLENSSTGVLKNVINSGISDHSSETCVEDTSEKNTSVVSMQIFTGEVDKEVILNEQSTTKEKKNTGLQPELSRRAREITNEYCNIVSKSIECLINARSSPVSNETSNELIIYLMHLEEPLKFLKDSLEHLKKSVNENDETFAEQLIRLDKFFSNLIDFSMTLNTNSIEILNMDALRSSISSIRENVAITLNTKNETMNFIMEPMKLIHWTSANIENFMTIIAIQQNVIPPLMELQLSLKQCITKMEPSKELIFMKNLIQPIQNINSDVLMLKKETQEFIQTNMLPSADQVVKLAIPLNKLNEIICEYGEIVDQEKMSHLKDKLNLLKYGISQLNPDEYWFKLFSSMNEVLQKILTDFDNSNMNTEITQKLNESIESLKQQIEILRCCNFNNKEVILPIQSQINEGLDNLRDNLIEITDYEDHQQLHMTKQQLQSFLNKMNDAIVELSEIQIKNKISKEPSTVFELKIYIDELTKTYQSVKYKHLFIELVDELKTKLVLIEKYIVKEKILEKSERISTEIKQFEQNASNLKSNSGVPESIVYSFMKLSENMKDLNIGIEAFVASDEENFETSKCVTLEKLNELIPSIQILSLLSTHISENITHDDLQLALVDMKNVLETIKHNITGTDHSQLILTPLEELLRVISQICVAKQHDIRNTKLLTNLEELEGTINSLQSNCSSYSADAISCIFGLRSHY
ncbi:hypothetical protein WA026_018454 [Henosepilachna vigintioctopunctata]|uniref:Uncharacterized protein n=1 Tax=Henosepilachna vigintioctopunctata TaxID=420089 RepID=A0AAW1V3W2_9CUCU